VTGIFNEEKEQLILKIFSLEKYLPLRSFLSGLFKLLFSALLFENSSELKRKGTFIQKIINLV
jgi:hypothetical protein